MEQPVINADGASLVNRVEHKYILRHGQALALAGICLVTRQTALLAG